VRSASDTLTVNEIAATIQIEKGSQATSYAAYFEPIELCKIGDYQDYIYKDGSDWKIHKNIGKVVLDGSNDESWARSGQTTSSVFVAALTNALDGGFIDTTDTGANSLNEYFVYNDSTVVNTWKFNKDPSSTKQQYILLRFNISTIPDLASFKTWIASNNVPIYYPLATPTDTEITNEALIEQLDNVASAPLYTGVNNITTITPNEQGTLEIKYVTYDKYNQNKVYIWNDTLQQWQIIVP
jgi:hypothetical protein